MLDQILDVFTIETEKEKQINELSAMADHELADLGISRDQIEAFASTHTPDDRS